MDVSLKVAGIHWYFRSRSHAAELTAGYYNADGRDGYNAIVEMCAAHGAALTLTCVEMCDAQHPPHALCGPEGLLRQVPGPARVFMPVSCCVAACSLRVAAVAAVVAWEGSVALQRVFKSLFQRLHTARVGW